MLKIYEREISAITAQYLFVDPSTLPNISIWCSQNSPNRIAVGLAMEKLSDWHNILTVFNWKLNMLSRVELCRAVCTHLSAVVTQFPILQPTELDKFSAFSVFSLCPNLLWIKIDADSIDTLDASQLDSWVASAVCIGPWSDFALTALYKLTF